MFTLSVFDPVDGLSPPFAASDASSAARRAGEVDSPQATRPTARVAANRVRFIFFLGRLSSDCCHSRRRGTTSVTNDAEAVTDYIPCPPTSSRLSVWSALRSLSPVRRVARLAAQSGVLPPSLYHPLAVGSSLPRP